GAAGGQDLGRVIALGDVDELVEAPDLRADGGADHAGGDAAEVPADGDVLAEDRDGRVHVEQKRILHLDGGLLGDGVARSVGERESVGGAPARVHRQGAGI